jgi:hypothetical protein
MPLLTFSSSSVSTRAVKIPAKAVPIYRRFDVHNFLWASYAPAAGGVTLAFEREGNPEAKFMNVKFR